MWWYRCTTIQSYTPSWPDITIKIPTSGNLPFQNAKPSKFRLPVRSNGFGIFLKHQIIVPSAVLLSVPSSVRSSPSSSSRPSRRPSGRPPRRPPVRPVVPPVVPPSVPSSLRSSPHPSYRPHDHPPINHRPSDVFPPTLSFIGPHVSQVQSRR